MGVVRIGNDMFVEMGLTEYIRISFGLIKNRNVGVNKEKLLC
jgi:hypothetical protein